ncbi:MAG: hypothetical protein ABIU05_03965 [Nitrospirales bacterium]
MIFEGAQSSERASPHSLSPVRPYVPTITSPETTIPWVYLKDISTEDLQTAEQHRLFA